MLRRFSALVLLIFALVAPVQAAKNTSPPSQYHATQLAMFATESAAQAHCPKDQVVWLNTNSGIYHEKGMLARISARRLAPMRRSSTGNDFMSSFWQRKETGCASNSESAGP